MKCPACGYLSFDDLEKCRKCGGSLLSLKKERSEEKGSLHQEELFLPSQDREGSTEGETVSSPVIGDGEGEEEASPALSSEDDAFFIDMFAQWRHRAGANATNVRMVCS